MKLTTMTNPFENIALDKFSSTLSLADEKLLPFNFSCDSMSAKSACGSSTSAYSNSNNARQRELENRVWHKLDLWLLPVVTMFYLLSFLVGFLLSSVQFST
jgi:hypothetical protein